MHITISFNTKNSAFEGYFAEEVHYIMEQATKIIFENRETFRHLIDSNGNKVGELVCLSDN